MDGKLPHVLVIEDDPVHRMRVRFILEDCGHVVIEAADGEAGLAAAAQRRPDAVVLDIGLPGLSGLEVLERLQAVEATRALPVLMVTGLEEERLMHEAFELGAYDFITKPINEAVLTQRVNAMLRASENQRRLAASEQRLETVIRSLSGCAIFTVDPAGKISSWNSGAESLTGFPSSEAVGRTYDGFLAGDPEEARTRAASTLKEALAEGVSGTDGLRARKDGSTYHAAERINPMRSESGEATGFACVLRDRTQERELEDRLHQAQKMEAIGQLTGGMAHDFNNLLGVVVGNLELCLTDEGTIEGIRPMLSDALDAALRGSTLTNRLLAFARRQTLTCERIDVNELVSGARALLDMTAGKRVDVQYEARESCEVFVDRSQLESCLLNLAKNARDAMPDGGRLTISTGMRKVGAQPAGAQPALAPGVYATIAVADNGSGMPLEVRARIFEPFFTTKGVGRGSGLGLAMVFGFVSQSGGAIDVRSEPGQGTTFTIFLPRAQHAQARTVPADVPTLASGRTGQRVLAVEDDEALLRVVERRLKGLGYEVRAVTSASEALDALERERFDLVFSDVMMPGELDGVDLAWHVRRRWPAVKVVLTTGFSGKHGGASDERWHELRESVAVLEKPYREVDLARALAVEPACAV